MPAELNHPPLPNLETLIGLFYDDVARLGVFHEVSADLVMAPFRGLLAHHEHMTVTVELFHGGPVDVEVLDTVYQVGHYARKSLLRRQRDRAVVQFGIVRLNCQYLQRDVLDEIVAETIPLGRVLINHNVLREVELCSLWRIEPGPELSTLMQLQTATPIYGRTALIHCNGEPAVELLEIVSVA